MLVFMWRLYGVGGYWFVCIRYFIEGIGTATCRGDAILITLSLKDILVAVTVYKQCVTDIHNGNMVHIAIIAATF